MTPTFPLLGPLGLVPLPAKWRIHFGAPIDLSFYRAADAEDRVLIGELTEKVRQTIQQTVDELVQKRRSVLFG